LALDPSGPLHREPDRLLLEETPPAVALRPLLDVIGAGAHRLSEIAARLSQPATSLSRPMARLMDLGLVRRETPFGEPEKAGRRTLYRISDPFFRFWFRVVAPHRTALATAARKSRLSFWTARRPALVSETWEDLCRAAVPRLGIPSGGNDVWLPAKRWWHGNEPEWDVVSKTADGSAHLAGEVKWSDRPISDPELKRLCDDQAARPLPAGLPPGTLRALFVSATASPSSPAFGGVRVYDAAAVMKALVSESDGEDPTRTH
jgi:DNA-binding transcriptional ArsR family regulator